MILQGLPTSIIFDDIAKSEGLVFLSSLHFLTAKLPHIPLAIPRILTTEILAKRFILYMKHQNKFYDEKHFQYIQPFIPFKVRIPKTKKELEILACESEDTSRSLLYLIKQDGIVTHCYGGFYGEIQMILRNDVFSSWVRLGVDHVYLNLRRYKERMDMLVNEYRKKKITKLVDSILLSEPIGEPKVTVIVPVIGCENLISFLCENYTNNIAIDGLLEKLYFDGSEINKRNEAHARVRVTYKTDLDGNCDGDGVVSNENCHVIKIVMEDNPNDDNNSNRYHELCYMPFPTPFELKFLVSAMSPSYIHGIKYSKCVKIPDYLTEMSSKYRVMAAEDQNDTAAETGPPPPKKARILPVDADNSESKTAEEALIGWKAKEVKANRPIRLSYVEDSDSDSDNSDL